MICSRTAVESKSNRSCNHRLTLCSSFPVWVLVPVRRLRRPSLCGTTVDAVYPAKTCRRRRHILMTKRSTRRRTGSSRRSMAAATSAWARLVCGSSAGWVATPAASGGPLRLRLPRSTHIALLTAIANDRTLHLSPPPPRSREFMVRERETLLYNTVVHTLRCDSGKVCYR